MIFILFLLQTYKPAHRGDTESNNQYISKHALNLKLNYTNHYTSLKRNYLKCENDIQTKNHFYPK